MNKVIHKQRDPCPFEREFAYDEKCHKDCPFPADEEVKQGSKIFTTKIPYFGEVSKSKPLLFKCSSFLNAHLKRDFLNSQSHMEGVSHLFTSARPIKSFQMERL